MVAQVNGSTLNRENIMGKINYHKAYRKAKTKNKRDTSCWASASHYNPGAPINQHIPVLVTAHETFKPGWRS